MLDLWTGPLPPVQGRPKIPLPGLVLPAYLTAAEFVPGAQAPDTNYASRAVGSRPQTVLEDHATSTLATHGDHDAEPGYTDAVGLVATDGEPVSKVTMNDALDLEGLVASPEDPNAGSVMSSETSNGNFEPAPAPHPHHHRRGRHAWKKLDLWE